MKREPCFKKEFKLVLERVSVSFLSFCIILRYVLWAEYADIRNLWVPLGLPQVPKSSPRNSEASHRMHLVALKRATQHSALSILDHSRLRG